jgi:hypothetical protein
MTIAPPPHLRGKSEFISQSECRNAQRCHLRWFARWPLALQTGDESPPQRIGSIGHAVLASMTLGDIGPYLHRVAAVDEAYKRGWFGKADIEPDWFEGEFLRGYQGATLIDAHVPRGAPVRLPGGTPLIEHRLKVTWGELMAIVPSPMFAAFERIGNGLARLGGRSGIEGQPDLAHRATFSLSDLFGDDIRGGVTATYIDDYKFRQKPDLGGALGKPDVTTVDPQGAFYSVLLRASGAIGPDEPVAFRQINAYAGRWLTVDDFVDERVRVQASGARGRLTLDSGLPSRDVERMEAMVTPETWAEAHRVLANLRHDDRRAQHEARLHMHRQALADYAAFKAENPKTRRQPPREPAPPDRLTATEEADARAFVADLAARPLYQVQTCSLDPGACLELVRDMLAAVLSAETELANRLPPARTFDPHPRGPCVRPYGCDLLGPCKASLGSGNAVATLQDFAERANMRRSLTVLPSGVGDDPADDGGDADEAQDAAAC